MVAENRAIQGDSPGSDLLGVDSSVVENPNLWTRSISAWPAYALNQLQPRQLMQYLQRRIPRRFSSRA